MNTDVFAERVRNKYIQDPAGIRSKDLLNNSQTQLSTSMLLADYPFLESEHTFVHSFGMPFLHLFTFLIFLFLYL